MNHTEERRRGVRLETKGEIRRAMEGEVRTVNFPEWVGAANAPGEARSIEINLSGKIITIVATPYQTLGIEER